MVTETELPPVERREGVEVEKLRVEALKTVRSVLY
jgi:hypothetical protein